MTGWTSLRSKLFFNLSVYSACEDFYMLDNLSKLIKLWEDESIFAKTFCDLMHSYLRPKMDAARSKNNNFSTFEMQA